MTHHAYPLVAIRDDGTTIVAATPQEAATFNALRPGPFHARGYVYMAAYHANGPVHRKAVERHEWIVRDAYGDSVLHGDLPRPARKADGRRERRVNQTLLAIERGIPIPSTGRRRRYSSGFRGFRQNVTARAADAALEADLADWGVDGMHVGRRLSDELPQVWDDVAYRWGRRGGWKTHRDTQWR